ncbi:uncharacterized protein LOC125805065 [Astyanax mexicanus]|uniref:Uncharacterized protein n=1 Tax=Astyanax mexicanus TaxID=7994 RepID=A0A8T2LKG1_ASTMX|nr:uncharacterized protein LOC125805065 [Astyanax mexicanus]KAG9271354.1 hypothetical protein AMEX_G14267 [Astyanax mexicanus]
MALFGKVLEPVGFMQSMRVLVEGICTYLNGNATSDDMDLVKKNLDHIDHEFSSFGPGLLTDQEVHCLENDLAVVYSQLGASVRAQPEFTKREKEVFLRFVQEYRLERQLTALYSRMMGISVLTDQPTLLEELVQKRKPRRWQIKEFCVKVNFVLGTGLLCLFIEASLTGRDQALLMKSWSDRMAALYRKLKSTGGLCSGYFREQAQEDVKKQILELKWNTHTPEEQAAEILKSLERNYDWLRWAVMVHPPVGSWQEVAAEDKDGAEEQSSQPSLSSEHFISVCSEVPNSNIVACFRDTPSSLDKSRIHQLIVDLEWKIPNPPPEIYAAIEEDPGKARLYLANRMLKKLQEGLGTGVAIHVVPGKMEMKCNFPQASYYQYEYKHRLASGTVCVFG